ncbi:MAG: thioredoxin domain-containing protein [Bacteroidota bacterium]
MNEPVHTNSLINESSPYLLQHAHNPVNWVSWSPAVFERAKEENKLVLISIGYSACHWCHVMEHESFEDAVVAEVMNRNFICVKIDREEHPHVDSLYMTAVQLMQKQGGWPLNCFTLPDGRPVYGGTYFPKTAWIDILNSLAELYKNEPAKVLDYGQRITEVIRSNDVPQSDAKAPAFYSGMLSGQVDHWTAAFDHVNGGPNRAPKFPLPTNYRFLLHYGHLMRRPLILDHVHLTRRKMDEGGIYDQIGGGFARYSVDELWKVPHFEKMLYDNAQLVSLYCEAFRQSGDRLYKKVAEETLEFIANELTNPAGGFYAALDADSEGVEGKYYVWTAADLKKLLDDKEFSVVENHFNINKKGYWEHDNYILLRSGETNEAESLGLSESQFESTLSSAKKKLLDERAKRVKPALDDKILLSWNALAIKAYADAARTFGKPEYLEIAVNAMTFIEQQFTTPDGGVYHTHKNGVSRITGLLEDYALLIDAYLALYQGNFEESNLEKARKLTAFVIENFSDEEGIFFLFNHKDDDELIARKKEISDNVIPSGNSLMAENLFTLGNYYYHREWTERSAAMLQSVWPLASGYLPGYSNWASLALKLTEPFHEVAITGKDAADWAQMEAFTQYHPNALFAVSRGDSELPMLKGKYSGQQTQAHVCHNKFCEKPFTSFEELREGLK